MQEIKFRGKVVNHDPMTNPENGWVEGYYLQDLDNGVVKHYIFNCPCCWEVVSDTIGQFTGFKDDDGKDVYEGDVVVERDFLFESKPYVVKYDASYGAFKFFDSGNAFLLSFDFLDMKVIGNIHDNPNLLTNGRD